MATVTVNHVRNQLRRRKVRRIIELRPAPPERLHTTEPGLLARDLVQRGYRLLDSLRASDRIALILSRVEERSIDEVARVCRCSRSTIKRRLQRAELQLSTLLESDTDLYNQIRGREGGP